MHLTPNKTLRVVIVLYCIIVVVVVGGLQPVHATVMFSCRTAAGPVVITVPSPSCKIALGPLPAPLQLCYRVLCYAMRQNKD